MAPPGRGGGPRRPPRTLNIVLPRAAGDSATAIPAPRMASILSPAPPLPPEMIAPAWPMRRPGGAGAPAGEPATRFLRRSAPQEARGFPPGAPADLADHQDAGRLVVAKEQLQAVDEAGAIHGIAADADAGRLAEPGGRGLGHRLVGQRARARDEGAA